MPSRGHIPGGGFVLYCDTGSSVTSPLPPSISYPGGVQGEEEEEEEEGEEEEEAKGNGCFSALQLWWEV